MQEFSFKLRHFNFGSQLDFLILAIQLIYCYEWISG